MYMAEKKEKEEGLGTQTNADEKKEKEGEVGTQKSTGEKKKAKPSVEAIAPGMAAKDESKKNVMVAAKLKRPKVLKYMPPGSKPGTEPESYEPLDIRGKDNKMTKKKLKFYKVPRNYAARLLMRDRNKFFLVDQNINNMTIDYVEPNGATVYKTIRPMGLKKENDKVVEGEDGFPVLEHLSQAEESSE